ncbi:MAG TPA: D-alanine--D-alanine ligase family protein [Propionibacteriaceae bacterium]|nr:D-alanine--D-alanine ligase family protein [Propionibacteriaceae bacterium]
MRSRVLLVFGGDSSEHEVSCLTAGSVLRALDRDRFDVTCVGIAKGGRWVWVEESVVRGYAIVDGHLPSVDASLRDAVLVRTGSGADVARLEGDVLVDRTPVDVAFALLHGPFGEDGTIQGLFEMMGVRYVGAGVLSSAACQDKGAMKQQFAVNDLPSGPYVIVTDAQWRAEPDACLARIRTLASPWFVKPARGGSSMGITRVTDAEGLPDAIAEARRYDPQVIVEQGIVGAREIECAVLGSLDGPPAASLPGEIDVHTESRFYDFATKYLPDQPVSLVIPADLPPEVVEGVRDLAVRAFVALGVEGLARVDTFVMPDGTVTLNEINTMPGFTATSMYPKLWEAAGVGYTTLVTRLLDLALARPLGLR